MLKKSLDNFKSLYSSNNNDTKNDLKDYNEPKPAKVDTDLSDIPIDKDEFPLLQQLHSINRFSKLIVILGYLGYVLFQNTYKFAYLLI